MIDQRASCMSDNTARIDKQIMHNTDISPNNSANEHIERLESFSYEKGSYKTDHTVIRVCSASIGCPKLVIEINSLKDKINNKIDDRQLTDHLFHDIQGKIPFHQRFRVAISGCPNTCSQPQISDFGVIARAMPVNSTAECINCGKCVSACIENSVEVFDNEAVIDYITCVGCSDCARACPTGAIRADRKGFTVTIGGRLGRHPQLAQEIVHLATEDEVIIALDTCLGMYIESKYENERFSYNVNRIGWDTYITAVGAVLSSHRQRFSESKKKVYHVS
ncbi:MAG: 4Fe-4S dicluster domain-containing protein [Armatimonadota bacterium]